MKSFLWCLVAFGGLLFFPKSADGFRQPERKELANFDSRQGQNHAAKSGEGKTQNEATNVVGLKIDFDEILGTPKLVRAEQGFLTGTNNDHLKLSTKALKKFPTNDTDRMTKAFLEDHAALFGQGADILDSATIKRRFVSSRTGMQTTVWEQNLNGISIFEGFLVAHTTRKAELINLSSQLVPNLAKAAKKNLLTLTAQNAIMLAAKNLDETILEKAIVYLSEAQGAERMQKFKADVLKGQIIAHLVWLPMDKTSLRLCWEIILASQIRGESFRILIDAQTGDALLRQNLTHYLSDASYRVFTSDSPSPFSPGFSVPMSDQPSVISRDLVTTNAFNTNASPNGWINDGDNETRGNNVDAHLDLNADDVADLPRPQGSPFRVFDFPLDLAQAPITYSDASVVQLFFLSNWFHDKLYKLGFTEAAGNFQADNFGRGGAGGDAVQADAQDGEGFNNANFTSAGDGFEGRMQMYIFTGPNPDHDGSLDAEIVFHELTHGVSSRLVGGGVDLTASQSMGMGEGWSDFYALCLLAQNGDDINGNYPFAGYSTFQFQGLMENYYFGIRRYPYSTDLGKNPLTFKDIDPTQANSHPGIPKSPSVGSSSASEVHNQGEVWCSALWEVRAALVAKHGFSIGNQLALQLVTDGMILSPPNPNFLQSRDAILQADQVDNNGANYDELWSAFAKRGLGFFAQSPSSSTTTGVIESFDLPDDLLISPQTLSTASGKTGGPFTHQIQTLTLTNSRTNTVEWSVGTSVLWLTLSPTNGTLAPGQSENVVLTLNPNANSLAAGVYEENVAFTNLVSGVVQTRSLVLAVGQPDYLTEFFEQGDLILGHQTFTFTPDGSANFYSVCQRPTTNFPTEPTGGTPLSLTDDSFATITLTNQARVGIYGQSNNTFYIGSNGYITFDSGDQTFDPSLKSHFNRPRISALFADLLPSSGQVSWKQLSDHVAVTYSGVREYSFPTTNQFQVELFYDGTIRLTYLRIDARLGLVGLSRGTGIPAGLVESDFLAYETCVDRPVVTKGFLNPEGNFTLEFFTEADASYSVELSDDLQNWTNVEPPIIGTGEIVQWVDTNASSEQTSRFYRVRLQQ